MICISASPPFEHCEPEKLENKCCGQQRVFTSFLKNVMLNKSLKKKVFTLIVVIFFKNRLYMRFEKNLF